MTTIYKHTQIGYIIIIPFVIIILVLTGTMLYTKFIPQLLIALAVFVFSMLIFGALTIIIDEEKITASFGMGIIKKRFYFKDIVFCQAVKNSWYYGWGIHLTPYGWLYNVSGFSAVELKMREGKGARIGTDEPEVLARAINGMVPKS